MVKTKMHRAGVVDGSLAIDRAGVAAITMSRASGGVAHVARLVHQALAERLGSPPLTVTLEPAAYMRSSSPERARFVGRLLAAQLLRRCDHLVFDHQHLARTQALLPPRLRVPYAVMLHDRESWAPGMDAARRAALRGARNRIAVSRFTAARTRAEYPGLGEIDVCPLALLPEPPSSGGEVDEQLLSVMNDHVVLIVGRMWSADRHKGHDQLLDCWPAVLRDHPAAQLLVVGDGDDRARLEARTESLGLGDSVIFTGLVDDDTRDALYRRAALFALPGRQEGFGLVYLEAMRAGLACIAGDSDAASEVVRQGETGLLVSQEPGAIARAVSALLSNPGLRRSLGEAGRRRFESHFTFDRFGDRLMQVLRLERRDPRPANLRDWS